MQSSGQQITIWLGDQSLELTDAQGKTVARYPISSAAKGIGFKPGSNKTPTGRFRIAEKIGEGAPKGMVFRSRKPTGEIATKKMEGDVVATRILWLDGLGKRNANSKERYIYIHGTNREDQIGTPASHGCIRMRNADVIRLFDRVAEGCAVWIRRGVRGA